MASQSSLVTLQEAVSALAEHVLTVRTAQVVETAPLAGLLEDFVCRWRDERPAKARQVGGPNGGSRAPNSWDFLDPYEYLTQHKGIPKQQIDQVLARTEPYTNLSVADSLVASMGLPEVFYQPFDVRRHSDPNDPSSPLTTESYPPLKVYPPLDSAS